MAFLNNLDFRTLLWLVPVFFTLHNLEEALSMESWSKRLPVKTHPTVSTRQFVVAVTFLTLAGFLLTSVSLIWLPPSIGYLFIMGIQMILLVNAFIPHLVTTIHFRLYSPGVVTATLITIPFSVYLFQRAFAEQVLTWRQFGLLLGIAPFAMVVLAYLSLLIGKVLTRNLPMRAKSLA